MKSGIGALGGVTGGSHFGQRSPSTRSPHLGQSSRAGRRVGRLLGAFGAGFAVVRALVAVEAARLFAVYPDAEVVLYSHADVVGGYRLPRGGFYVEVLGADGFDHDFSEGVSVEHHHAGRACGEHAVDFGDGSAVALEFGDAQRASLPESWAESRALRVGDFVALDELGDDGGLARCLRCRWRR